MSAEPLELGLAAIANGLRLLLEGLSVATASPSADHLIQLAVVAVIRTVLNVFLARELASERTGAEP